MAEYDERIERISQVLAEAQYNQPLLQGELTSLQWERIESDGVDVDKLYNGTADERRAEWGKIDTRALGRTAGDTALQRVVLPSIGKYGSGFMEDTEKFRNGELKGEALEHYEAIRAMITDSTGYDEEGFVEAAEDLNEHRNLGAAAAQHVERMAGWYGSSKARTFQRDISRNYTKWRQSPDEEPDDLTKRLMRTLNESTRKHLDDMLRG